MGSAPIHRYRLSGVFDYSVTPAHLDIEWAAIGKLSTIIRFIDDDRLEIADSDPGQPRPETFDDDAVLLTRER